MGIAGNIGEIRASIPQNVLLVAVSKTQPAESIIEAYEAGQRVFGENKAQEVSVKYSVLPKDIQWHFIGHLQTNKVRYIAPFVTLIHSIDSLKLLKEVNREAAKSQRVIDCLLEFYIATEETKFGLSLSEAEEIISHVMSGSLPNIRITGIMGMASFSEDSGLVRSEFKTLKNYFDLLKSKYFTEAPWFREISMGMTHDYRIALEEGSTMIRIGTAIFGERNY